MSKKNNNIINNNKAYYNFSVKNTFIAGIVLKGWEVKSIRKKKIDISKGYVLFRFNELYLNSVKIEFIQAKKNYEETNALRERKLLLTKKEIKFIYEEIKKKKYTIIPLSLFWKKNWCKIKIGLSKGKKKYDKRNTERKKSWKMEQLKIMKKNTK
ncbi:SsrA-binding protein SmpB [Buchnera aphidicola (Mindarus keteleerifoliae)]|uniref:SsrA-binding protein SmpB n=1 Tax=Buchnera aphidicola TaxID=9 RepID=UPI0031B6BA0F